MADAEVFRLLDGDGDGTVSAAEWRERKMVLFYLLDADNDIYLERGEVPGMSEDAFAAADLDGDGRLSGFEFNQATFTQFRDGGPRPRGRRHVRAVRAVPPTHLRPLTARSCVTVPRRRQRAVG
jgi:EF hand domain-containing protein